MDWPFRRWYSRQVPRFLRGRAGDQVTCQSWSVVPIWVVRIPQRYIGVHLEHKPGRRVCEMISQGSLRHQFRVLWIQEFFPECPFATYWVFQKPLSLRMARTSHRSSVATFVCRGEEVFSIIGLVFCSNSWQYRFGDGHLHRKRLSFDIFSSLRWWNRCLKNVHCQHDNILQFVLLVPRLFQRPI